MFLRNDIMYLKTIQKLVAKFDWVALFLIGFEL